MKKEKNVVVSSSTGHSQYGSGGEEERERYGGETSSVGRRSSFSTISLSPRNTSSKYDFVKVKVWLGDNCDHYYVLSRFLLSRMLTVTKIPNHIAVKIALELKKLLIDYSLLDVSQSDLEATLFKLMTRRGFGEEYISRYNMMTRLDFFERPDLQLPATTRTLVHTFHHQRVPLVILVCGTVCSGKSTLATQLAQRLNLPNVLQTEMVYELLRTSTDAPLASAPVWARNFSSSEELITEFCRECRIVRKGLAGDLKKAMKDGKPIIIEGVHLDPSIYLMDDETKLTSKFPTKNVEANSLPVTSENTSSVQTAMESPLITDIGNNSTTQASCDGVSVDDQMNQLSLEAINLEGSASENIGGTVKALEKDKTTTAVKEMSGLQPVVVPMVIKMAEFDHKALLEEWISTRTFSDKGLIQDKDRLMSNLRIIQDYLCSFKSQGLTVVNVSATTFAQTLDWMHSHLLQCIEQGISPVI